MRWPFVEWGATLIMNGHVHYYERLQVDGLYHVINGLGGADDVYAFDVISNYSQFRYNETWGAQRVTANSTHVVLTFVNVDGAVIDTVVVPSRPPLPSATTRAPSAPLPPPRGSSGGLGTAAWLLVCLGGAGVIGVCAAVFRVVQKRRWTASRHQRVDERSTRVVTGPTRVESWMTGRNSI